MLLMKLRVLMVIVAFSASSLAADYKTATDGEYVTLTGEVTKVAADAFNLSSKHGKLLIEMDDFDWDADGYKLVKGDNVIVTGRVDHDFLEKKKVEAGTVYVKGINSYFYASSADEEGSPYLASSISYIPVLKDNAVVDMTGRVIGTDGRSFTIDTGLRKIKVDTSEMHYDPMDNRGMVQVDVGDRVRVGGQVEEGFFTGKELEANYIAELS